MGGAQQVLKFRSLRIPGNDHAAGFFQPEIHRVQQERHGLGNILQPVRKSSQGGFGRFPQIVTAGDGREFQQCQRGDGIAGRFRPVIIVFHPQNQILRVGGALPEAAIFRVVKFHHHGFGERNRKIEMLRIQRGFVKLNHPVGQESIGFEQLNIVAFAVTPAVEQRSRRFVP